MGIEQLKGAIFDLDGVITQTAVTHFKAWKETFNSFLEKQNGQKYNPFTKNDYLTYVDGKPRYKGVQSFLESRGIRLPYGDDSDDESKITICGIGNRKNNKFREIVKEEGVKIYDSSLKFIDDLKSHGIKIGLASSSKNCRYILEKTGLIDKFESIVGGIVSKERNLKGKPEPDIFISAADDLHLLPSECLMVEDAEVGVAAGKKGNFALVIGVAREENHEALRRFGGDYTVSDLSEITWNDILKWFEEGIDEDSWKLNYHGFNQNTEKLRETLTTVGNGYFATRGCFEGEVAEKDIHYPGTYIAGLYNKVPTVIHDKKIYNNDFVNCPNWLPIDFKIGKDKFIDVLKSEILYYNHVLDMKTGVMSRKIKIRDINGRITIIESERIASMDNHHLGAIRYRITPYNYFEPVTIKSSIDGTVTNYGVPRYRSLSNHHLNAIRQETRGDSIFLHVKTNESNVDIYMHADHKLYEGDKEVKKESRVEKNIQAISKSYTIDCEQLKTYTIEKIVSIYTSGDKDTEDPEKDGLNDVLESISFDCLVTEHKRKWNNLWNIADIRIEGDRFSQKTTRLHIYHLLVTASPHNKHIDAGIPARGLHGEAYRGHIFWDELFIMPFYNLHFPEVSRSALLYRYRRLDAAREYAKANGYDGAMFPWQTANDGSEETQEIHYNPVSGAWDPDLSRLQRHVSLAIAYNVLEYSRITRDKEFMREYGAEIMFEITRFWAHIAEYDKNDGKYHIMNVMGPDEFQEKYPDSYESGLNDNAYTNVMVAWLMDKMIHFIDTFNKEELDEIIKKLKIKKSEIKKWKQISDNLYVEFNDDGVMAQFKVYFDLKELDWDHYRKKYDSIRRMDRILKAENDSPNRYKVSKQADTLMLFYVLTPPKVKEILEGMNYEVGDAFDFLRKNYDYYFKRTSHGSTLSYVVHAAILKYLEDGKYGRWEWFMNAMESDIYDTQGGTTEEGIHTGVMAGTIDIILQSFAGLEYGERFVKFNPDLPLHWTKLRFKFRFRNNLYELEIKDHKIKATLVDGIDDKIDITVKDKKYELSKGEPLEIELSK